MKRLLHHWAATSLLLKADSSNLSQMFARFESELMDCSDSISQVKMQIQLWNNRTSRITYNLKYQADVIYLASPRAP